MAKGITINEALRRIERLGYDQGMLGSPYCSDTEAAKVIFGALKKRNKPGRFGNRRHLGGLKSAVGLIKNSKSNETKVSIPQISADQAIANKIEKLSLTLERKTLTQNSSSLLEKIYRADIASLLREQGFLRIFSWDIDHPTITEIGFYKVKVNFPLNISAIFALWVVPAP